MSMHTIEPGQRLRMLVGGDSTTVSVISEAVVPVGYWICRDESCGQQRVVAHTVLAPLLADPLPNVAPLPAPAASLAAAALQTVAALPAVADLPTVVPPPAFVAAPVTVG